MGEIGSVIVFGPIVIVCIVVIGIVILLGVLYFFATHKELIDDYYKFKYNLEDAIEGGKEKIKDLYESLRELIINISNNKKEYLVKFIVNVLLFGALFCITYFMIFNQEACKQNLIASVICAIVISLISFKCIKLIWYFICA